MAGALAMTACSAPAAQQPAPTTSPAAAPAAASGPAPQENSAQGDIPDNQQYVAYALPSGHSRLNVPEGWARTDLPGGNGATFTDKLNTIRIEVRPARAAPTVTTVLADVAAQNRTAAGFAGLAVSTVTRSAAAVVLARYQVNSPVDPVTNRYVKDDVERYEFFRAGSLALITLITLSAPHGSDNVDPWRRVTESFRWR
ncbi:hypothetical protein [Fodinicola feengrottensis]|nr:hypothetical protein [Fodinicola feengrottensis]